MRLLILLCAIALPLAAFSQAPYWKAIQQKDMQLSPESVSRNYLPNHYQLLELDYDLLKKDLSKLSGTSKKETIQIPLPNGQFEAFEIWETPVMQAGLAAKYPEIKSFSGKSINNKGYTVKLGYTYKGFYASILTPEGKILVDPFAKKQDRYYFSYNANDFDLSSLNLPDYKCGVHDEDHPIIEAEDHVETFATDRSLTQNAPVEVRQYRIAIAAAGEFTAEYGPSKAEVVSEFSKMMNRTNQVFEADAAITFILIDGLDEIIFTSALTDPFTTPGNLGTVLNANPTVFAVIPTQLYDIGHTMTNSCNGGGVVGLASLSSVCNSNPGSGNHKSRGATCAFVYSDVEDLAIQIFAHEIGHQFAATHSFNNCGGNESAGTAYEPGSGSTIMSYAGACGGNNVQFFSDDYFNIGSIVSMVQFSRVANGNSCPVIVPNGNTEPELELPYTDGFFIPIGTPFELTAIATDVDNDQLTYCWEQYNLGPTSPLGNPAANAPAFRSFLPTPNPTRVFPRMQNIVNNTTTDVEVLPTISRLMNFTCTVRDNFPGGSGTIWEEVAFEATDQAGPFLVQSPNASGIEWTVGDYVEVTWNVANTNLSPVNCKTVNIRLSLDGGFTYPITLAEGAFNDGSQFITVPDNVSSTARVRVEAADNIFFDISNNNFSILPPASPTYTLNAGPLYQEICTPTEVVIDINTASILDYDTTIQLSVFSGLPTGATAEFADSELSPSESTTLTINFDNVTVEGLQEIVIEATSGNQPPSYRTFEIFVTFSDFSSFGLIGPEDGASGVSALPTFNWTPLPNATYYDFELSLSPAFDTITDAAYGIDVTTYESGATLENGTVYYWRVRPGNACKAGEYAELPFAFVTLAFSCTQYEATDLPQPIPSVGTPTIESKIFVPNGGSISDINVRSVSGYHNSLQYLNVYLRSPAGTERLLFGNSFCTAAIFSNIKFDDDAPTTVSCPPVNNGNYKPKQSFDPFLLEDALGEWTLSAKVTDNFGEGGALDAFVLEICSDVNLNGPFIVTNEILPVRPSAARLVSDTFLLVEDNDNLPTELIYTLVKAPEHGKLYRLGTIEQKVGDIFYQYTLNNDFFHYDHDGSPEPEDSFYFTVHDGSGGWIGITKFTIVMDEDAPVLSVKDINTKNAFTLFPNPASNFVQLQFEKPLRSEAVIEMFNVAGQRLLTQSVAAGTNNYSLNAANMPKGIYMIKVSSKEGSAIERLIVQ